jgi:hypothetical protein
VKGFRFSSGLSRTAAVRVWAMRRRSWALCGFCCWLRLGVDYLEPLAVRLDHLRLFALHCDEVHEVGAKRSRRPPQRWRRSREALDAWRGRRSEWIGDLSFPPSIGLRLFRRRPIISRQAWYRFCTGWSFREGPESSGLLTRWPTIRGRADRVLRIPARTPCGGA